MAVNLACKTYARYRLTIPTSQVVIVNLYINRYLSSHIMELSRHFPAVVLTGARQVGKTTLFRRAFPNDTYVSLDLPSVAESAETEPETILKRYPPPLIVDEIQYAPKLFRHLKHAIDADRHAMGRFILTGSQKFVLMKEVSDNLAGRVAILELEGLSLHEVGTAMDSFLERVVR